jgi:nicotinamidase-related amidase
MSDPPAPRRALLIVDMQRGSFTSATPRYDAEGLVGRLNELAGRVRRSGGLVIFVQHEGPPDDAHHPGKPGFDLLADLHVQPGDRRVLKQSCDAFLGTDLEEVLASAAIGELIVTGCATDFCVDTTIRSALARGYATIAPADGHTTADRPHLDARTIIEHHNAIWADFLSPAGPAKVCACNEV